MVEMLLIADASTLLNFLHVKRFDLIHALGYHVCVVDAVCEEILDEKIQLDDLVENGQIRKVSLEGEAITRTVASLLGRGLGSGESFSVAAAIEFSGAVALDDRRAINRAREEAPGLVVLTSIDIMVAAITATRLTIPEADQIKAVWEQEYRFRLKFDSFANMMEASHHEEIAHMIIDHGQEH